MMSQAVNQFDWVEFYKEFAEKLLAYKDNRQELIIKVKQILWPEQIHIRIFIDFKEL
jgi:5-methylcytosine-specific restriction protein B